MWSTSVRYIFLLLCVAPIASFAQEICDNGIDDDADGLIDLNDTTDCACTGAVDLTDSFLVNPSFEDMVLCPMTYSYMSYAVGWTQATFSTSDYFNQCGFFPSWIPTPLPDGQACVGGYQTNGYQEYVGTCLNGPLLAGEHYTMRFSIAAFLADNFELQSVLPINFGSTDIVVWGLPSCPNWPLSFACLDDVFGISEIGTVSYTPSNDWQTIAITLSPTQNVNAIIIGGPCALPASYGTSSDPDQYYPYFLYDGFSIGKPNPEVTPSGGLCLNDLELILTGAQSAAGFQWYQNGIALPQATDSVLEVSSLGLGVGSYTCVSLYDTTCASSAYEVVQPVVPVPVIVWDADYLTTSGVGTFQWFLNGQPIDMAFGPFWLPEVNGEYTVQLTDLNGCTAMSAPFNVLTAGVAALGDPLHTITVDPSTRDISVIGPHLAARFELLDPAGRLVLVQRLTASDTRISTAGLSRGVYIARTGDKAVRLFLP